MKLATSFRFLNNLFSKFLINNYKKYSYHHHHYSRKLSLVNHIINKSASSSLLFQNSNKYQSKNDSIYSYSTTTSGLFIKEIIKDTTSLSIKWSNSNTLTKFNYIWLRDNCQCPLCIHPDNRQKLFLSSEIPLNI